MVETVEQAGKVLYKALRLLVSGTCQPQDGTWQWTFPGDIQTEFGTDRGHVVTLYCKILKI